MNSFALKIIASVCMLIDHVGYAFKLDSMFRVIGRISFPIYIFLVAQGCRYTKNINKYMYRLGVFALVSEIPYDLVFHRGGEINFFLDTNVFYTLFLGVMCINIYEQLRKKEKPYIALIALPLLIFVYQSLGSTADFIITFAFYIIIILVIVKVLPDSREKKESLQLIFNLVSLIPVIPIIYIAKILSTDYGMFGVATILIVYLAKEKVFQAITLALSFIYFYSNRGDMFIIFAILSVIMILLYNGEQGPKLKWAFYCFYPVHLAVIAVMLNYPILK